MTIQEISATRRAFLAGTGGLVIGFALMPKVSAFAAESGVQAGGPDSLVTLNTFVRIGTDDMVTILSKHIEFGQGPFTGLATLVAEELDADWGQMRAVHSPADDKVYANLAFGLQGTGGSSSIANSYEQFRKAGATARAMLVAAAADEWNVPASEITVEKGRVKHAGSGKESGFGALATQAAGIKPPSNVNLKDPANFTLIGQELPKLDTFSKTNGQAIYTLDIVPDNLLVAVVAHPDHFGAAVKSFDDSEARKVKGVVDVKQLPQGVAVYADNTFAALKGRSVLKVEWDLSKAETRSSNQLSADYAKALSEKGIVASEKGDVEKTFGDANLKILEAQIVFPFLAHAPMEPLDAVFIKAADGSLDVYNGAQFPGMDKATAAKIVGLDPSKVRLNTQITGGSFGRKAQFGSPYMQEAAAVFAATDQSRPVKHMWTREDDIRGGYYRPMYLHKMRGAIDADGRIVAWDQAIVGQSILAKADLDSTSVEGASDLPYDVPNLRVVSHNVNLSIPPLWWRSVGHTHTGFAVETFLDELFQMAGKDPVLGRLQQLKEDPRYAGVLNKAAELADWGGKVPEGRERGVAVVKSFNTYVGQVVEVSAGTDGVPRVHKVWCAVDCGVAINPNVIKAQMEGGIGYGLGAVLFDAVTLGEGGAIMQSNFHDYRSIRINEMPDVEVAVIKSDAPPTGVGEPGVPPVGPATANAWRRLTGAPVRSLPIVAVATS
ncbi:MULTISPECIES: xanthine dehydrogenase family protein molybdopterin-binding subunit [unclassified Rhizobium]|uniref:xanthine dehydrogenase family protein molybdopterin-binding subunit n=1 Tax=unclassified Rhizobium TaxID=2613769 RepID=UPI00146C5F11|nr:MULTISPECIES: xanthine dehydrogenase family protein molybdopterin-binding subunit [unclassified Rhizobium]MBD9448295.1 xanthine dehydrogenase family protein molybdopterin-binding subunit [Rhizobium sp. RHZ01]MBD9453701.1 xanthine dehydrogenase family protein molybdopterin-binding subunit [Rhizobium sp. RHZ02]NMN72226.1 isoquinoline 1-oxidoreductase beta subunit [Rhizobium sp. 57MFTsu3.2]